MTGVRFYKAAANTGTHTGSLWTADGTRLAQATFSSETGSGWQKVTFATPVQVQPNTTYIASYHAPNGHYSATKDHMWPGSSPGPHSRSTLDAKPLHAIKNFGTVTNGLYAYGTTSTFPTDSYSATNYWVDVMFTPTAAPGAVSNVSAVAAGTTSASVTWNAPTTGGAPSSYVVTPYIGSTAQTPRTVTGSPLPTSTTVTGLTNGHDLPLHRPGRQPGRQRARVGALERRHPAQRRGADRAARRGRASGDRGRAGRVDGAPE